MQMNQQDQAGVDFSIDIRSLSSQLREQLSQITGSSTSSTAQPVIISRVHEGARNVDSGEYTPQHVSIGPYHHPRKCNLHLLREQDKMVSLKAVLSVSRTAFEAFIEALASLEVRARVCYSENIDMSSEEFLRMLLLDGCYILSGFCSIYNSADRHESYVTFLSDVLYLAENQIPFFVVKKIGELAYNSDLGSEAPVTIIKRKALAVLSQHKYAMTPPETAEASNLLHLFHMHMKPLVLRVNDRTGEQVRSGEKVRRWRTATAYHLAGVKLKSRNISTGGDAQCILDVKLQSGGGTLEIPVLSIYSDTIRLLRNLMALEQHNLGTVEVKNYVTAYCIFMSQLACEARDVELLSGRGIIMHTVANDQKMAEYFANLCRGVVFDVDDPDSNYLRTTWQELEEQCRSRPRRWVAWLKQKYFSNPWLAVGLLAAAVGLTCAVIQAVYSILK